MIVLVVNVRAVSPHQLTSRSSFFSPEPVAQHMAIQTVGPKTASSDISAKVRMATCNGFAETGQSGIMHETVRTCCFSKWLQKGHVRFLGEFACAGYEVTQAPDTDDQMREAFVFDLVPIDDLDDVVSESEWPPASDLSDLHRRALEAVSSEKQADAKSAKRNVYERSAAVREYVLARAAGQCEGCGDDAPFITRAGTPYLEPHHIRRLSDGGPDHPAFVAALCPNCHRRVHFGEDGDGYNRSIAVEIRKREPYSA